MKKVTPLKILAVAGIVVVSLVVIAVSVAWILFPPAKLKSLATEQAGKVLGREVTIGKAGVTFYPFLGITLSDVAIANTARPGYAQEAFVRFEKFMLEISVVSLIKKQPEIKKIILKKPRILIEVDSSGSFNFDDMAVMQKDSTAVPKEKKKGALPVLPVPLSLSLFAIEDGQIIYHDAKSGQDIVINDLDDKIVFSIDKDLKNITTKGDLSLANISLATKEIKKPLSNLVITLHHDIGADLVSGTAQVKSLRLSFQKVFLTVAGTISGLNDTPVFDLGITSDAISLQDLLNEVPVELAPVLSKMSAAGELLIGLQVKGSFVDKGPLPVSGTVAINNGMFKHSDVPKSVQQIALNCAFTDSTFEVSSLKLRCGDNPIALKAMIRNFKKPLIDAKLLADFNLAEVKDFAKLPAGVALSGKVFTDIAIQGEADAADPSKIAVQGKLDLGNVSVLTPPLTKPAVINGTFVLSSQAIGEELSVVIGASSMKMNAQIKNYLSFVFPDSTRKLPRPALDFNVSSSYMNFDEFLTPAKKEETAKDTTKSSNPPVIAPLPGVDVTGKIVATTLIYNKIPMKNATVIVSVLNDIAKIDLSTGFAQGTISEKLYADMRNVQNIQFTNNLTINSVEIQDIFGHFGAFLKPTNALNRELNQLPKSLLGKFNLTSSFSGSGGTPDAILDNLKGDVGLKMADGTITNSIITKKLSGAVEKFVKMEDITFKDFSGAFHVENKSVLVEKLKLLSDMGDWSVQGTVGFDANLGLTLSNRLIASHSEKLLKLQNSGKSALKGLLGNSQYAQAAGAMLDNTGVPADKEGRVTLLMALSGPASDPKASFTGFGAGTASSGEKPAASPKTQLLNKVTETVDNAKLEAQKRIDEERKQAEAALRQKADEQKQVIEQQKQVVEEKKQNVEQQIKKDAASKLKKLF